ncbi:41015_t:CDS:1, partial [Gigaspora margarita]
ARGTDWLRNSLIWSGGQDLVIIFVAKLIHKIVQLEALRGHNYCERPCSIFR